MNTTNPTSADETGRLIEQLWPELRYKEWKDTYETLHRWVQIIGKIRLSKSPWVNHGWHSALYVTETGLTTSVIHDRNDSFRLDCDWMSHFLRICVSNGRLLQLPLTSESVASFYKKCLVAFSSLGIPISIFSQPNELVDATPFEKDATHSTYDPVYANRLRLILLQCDRVMKIFRSRFVGKCSPVHFFWGSFDLAVTRFSGRRAPEHPGGVPHLPDLIARDAYSHEVSSCGFWPGNEIFQEPAFYSYAYPQPQGFEKAVVPTGGFYHEKLREFLLPYEAVRKAEAPDQLILEFFEATYQAAAHLGNWDRDLLEESSYLHDLQSKVRMGAQSQAAA